MTIEYRNITCMLSGEEVELLLKVRSGMIRYVAACADNPDEGEHVMELVNSIWYLTEFIESRIMVQPRKAPAE